MEQSASIRRSSCLVTILIALLWRFAPAASAENPIREAGRSEGRLILTLRWCDPDRLFQGGSERIGRAVQEIFGPAGIEVSWRTCDSGGEPSVDAARDIQVVLVHSEASEWNLTPWAMGAVLSQRGPQSQVYVFFTSIARVLGYSPEALRSRWLTGREERDVSRALSRVVAHEVVHAVLPNRPHAVSGITRFELDRASLLTDRTLDREVAHAFRTALAARVSRLEARSPAAEATHSSNRPDGTHK